MEDDIAWWSQKTCSMWLKPHDPPELSDYVRQTIKNEPLNEHVACYAGVFGGVSFPFPSCGDWRKYDSPKNACIEG